MAHGLHNPESAQQRQITTFRSHEHYSSPLPSHLLQQEYYLRGARQRRMRR